MVARLSWYEPLDWVLVRSPLLPIERYRELQGGGEAEVPEAARDPLVRRAIAVASPSLFERIGRPPSSASALRRRRLAVLRYLIRMSTRTTPYGLNAAVSLAQWGERTDLELDGREEARARIDMSLVDALIGRLESRLEVVRQLRVEAHPLVSVRAGRAFLPERFAGEGKAVEVSVRATRPVVRALALAGDGPMPFADLAEAIESEFQGAGTDRIEGLIHNLIREGLLLTELRPPLTRGDPTSHVLTVLERIDAAREERERLTAALSACERWQRLGYEQGAEEFAGVLDAARAVATTPADAPPVRVDMKRPLGGERIAREVGDEAARAAELLLRVSPLQKGAASLNSYRDKFVGRYGPHTEMPLVDLVDPHAGLGPVDLFGDYANDAPPDDAARRRDRRLLALASGALRGGKLSVELDPATVEDLDSGVRREDLYPTMEISAFVAASSREALDAGDFRVVVSPMLGSFAAGRVFGRFAYLFDGRGERAMRDAARRHEAGSDGGLWAELVYHPERPWLSNVMIRPGAWSHEIVVGAAPGVDRDRVILAKELVVGVRDDTFYLRWPRGGAYVQVTEGHMLNPKAAPAVGAFLALMRHAGRPVLTAFTWGSAAQLPRLPRVEAGRVVLSPATWRPPFGEGGLDPAGRERFGPALQSWRADWEMPRWVFAGEGDHRLLIDLDDHDQVELLRGLARSRHGGAGLVLQEALPGVDSAWLPGPGGRFLVELAVPLARRSASRDGSQRANARPPAELAPQARAARTRAPGSDWLFAKLYAGGAVAEQLIGLSLTAFAGDVLAAELAHDWFFIRYRDPRPHVRLRFRGNPERLTGELTARLYAWVAELIDRGACQSLAVDTYERELERYGGERGMEVAEAVFGVDSRAVADLVRLDVSGGITAQRELLSVLTLDRLLEGLGLDAAARLRWCSARASLRHEVMAEWRDHKDLLRSLLGSPGGPKAVGGEELVQLLDRFVADLRPHGDRLTALRQSGEIRWPSADELHGSFAHMHCNRLLGLDRDAERRALGLLHRTLDSLSRAPIG
jgi:thiopeptide-type bacteriocin biosynthesis protein